jgi:hypothetical protein
MAIGPPRGLCFVSYVSSTIIHLQGANGAWRRWLRAAGLPVSWWSGGVPYEQRDFDDLDDLLPKLAALAQLGVCFAEDYKQGMAPADIMRDLQARGCCASPLSRSAGAGRRRVAGSATIRLSREPAQCAAGACGSLIVSPLPRTSSTQSTCMPRAFCAVARSISSVMPPLSARIS